MHWGVSVLAMGMVAGILVIALLLTGDARK